MLSRWGIEHFDKLADERLSFPCGSFVYVVVCGSINDDDARAKSASGASPRLRSTWRGIMTCLSSSSQSSIWHCLWSFFSEGRHQLF